MTQYQMYKHLQKNMTTHSVSMERNKIIAKRLIRTRSFSNFKLTFTNGVISLDVDSYTKRFDNTTELFNLLGAFSNIGVVH